MRLFRHLVAAALVVVGNGGIGSSSVFAQQRHVVDPASMAGTVRAHVAAQDDDRATIQSALARPDVRRAAEAAGVDLHRLSAAVNTLAADDLGRTATAVRDVNAALDASLVGGASTVTISTTTIIIGLLVLILLIVALD